MAIIDRMEYGRIMAAAEITIRESDGEVVDRSYEELERLQAKHRRLYDRLEDLGIYSGLRGYTPKTRPRYI